jgi:hypothetical protein
MKKLFEMIGILLVVVMLLVGVPLLLQAATSSTVVSGDMAYGVVTGTTGTAIDVSIGWTPKTVIVTRVTNTLVRAEWQTGMDAASCLKTSATGTSGSGAEGVAIITLPTVSCISTYAGSTTAAKGFTLGTDTTINVTGATLRWQAYR